MFTAACLAPCSQVGDQATLLWGAVSQRRVWLPALFMLLWQGTPSSGGAFFYFLTDELGFGPEFLGRVSVGTSIASLVGSGSDWSRLRPMASGRCECA